MGRFNTARNPTSAISNANAHVKTGRRIKTSVMAIFTLPQQWEIKRFAILTLYPQSDGRVVSQIYLACHDDEVARTKLTSLHGHIASMIFANLNGHQASNVAGLVFANDE